MWSAKYRKCKQYYRSCFDQFYFSEQKESNNHQKVEYQIFLRFTSSKNLNNSEKLRTHKQVILRSRKELLKLTPGSCLHFTSRSFEISVRYLKTNLSTKSMIKSLLIYIKIKFIVKFIICKQNCCLRGV